MPRTYNSSRRAKQAADTRLEVLRAATELFARHGWAGTTLAAIAEEAGVSVETIYNGFDSKKGLLRTAIDVATVGDAEPIPYAERPEFFSLGEGTLEERVARGAAVVADANERLAGLWQALVEAASSDEEAQRWRRELEAGRRIDVGRSVELVLGAAPADDLVTLLWVLYSPEAYLKLTRDAGMSKAEYEAFMVEASTRLIPAG